MTCKHGYWRERWVEWVDDEGWAQRTPEREWESW